MTDDVHADLRLVLAGALRTALEKAIVAEWICCDPVRPDHDLCQQGYAVQQMVESLLADEPEPPPGRSSTVDALMVVVGAALAEKDGEVDDKSDVGSAVVAAWMRRVEELEAELSGVEEQLADQHQNTLHWKERASWAEATTAWTRGIDDAHLAVIRMSCGHARLVDRYMWVPGAKAWCPACPAEVDALGYVRPAPVPGGRGIGR